MHAEPVATQPRVQAICAAVGAYGWRALTAEMVVRRLLGALDGLLVSEVIGATPESTAIDLAVVEPADSGDARIDPMVQLLASFRWRALTLPRLVELVLEAHDQWWVRRIEFEDELARLLDDQR